MVELVPQQKMMKEITTQGQEGMLRTVKITNVPIINRDYADAKVEFDAFNLSSIRSQQSCDIDSDRKNLSLQNKKKLKHPTVNVQGRSRNI